MAMRGTGWATLAFLLVTAPAGAQEIINLPAGDRWLDLRIEDLYRVGSLGGEEWEQFGSVTDVAFDGEGNLHVFDNRAQRIVVVGVDGSYIREFGRRGEGPGEFRQATALAVARNGRAVVADVGRRVFHIFGANGDPGGVASDRVTSGRAGPCLTRTSASTTSSSFPRSR